MKPPPPLPEPDGDLGHWLVIAIIISSLITFFVVMLLIRPAKSQEQLSEIDENLAAYCSLYSREVVFIRVMHPTTHLTADTDYILDMAKREYGECLSVLPTLLPLPGEFGSLKSWLADIRDLVILRAGTKPANDPPEPVSTKLVDDVKWRNACANEYRTWDEETGTVIRNGNPDRVRCPLVLENGEWVIGKD
jgi:hypothetical protein